MRKTLFIPLILCSVLFIESSIATSSFLSSPCMNKIIIDGKWTAKNEWSDASEFSYERGKNVLGYFLIKDDEEFLYVMIDFVSDRTIDDKDMGRLRFDTENDKGWGNLTGCQINGSCVGKSGIAPLFDDYMMDLIWNKGSVNQINSKGNGSEWVLLKENNPAVQAATSNDSNNDPYSNLPHLIYEFAIPRQLFKNKTEIGFSLYAENKGERDLNKRYLKMPGTAHNLIPITWANLTLTTSYGSTESDLNLTTTFSPTPTPTSKIEKTPPRTSTTMDPPERTSNISPEDTPKEKSSDHQILLNNNLLMGMAFVVIISSILIYKIKRNKKL
ncbi:MAG: hypothetical protein O2U61_04225 [Candidatus Bathyarchaeota archaeon]|nr:hypothetical protein [Candidatus Bathyarchaeota archaeon]